ncbi:MAG: hypothetical protein WCY98_11525 [Castellaniella sp.]|nr:hypothetical protein [Pigmentiphaga sp.]
MKFVEMMMRALTHLNIGATIALAAWVVFSVAHAAQDGMNLSGLDARSSRAASIPAHPLASSADVDRPNDCAAAHMGEVA